jgi:hypothetical protein
MRTHANINLIWKHTHSDYRGKLSGIKSCLVLRSGGTTLTTIIGLTDQEFKYKLAAAKKRELSQ